jgi:hypothetical protein
MPVDARGPWSTSDIPILIGVPLAVMPPVGRDETVEADPVDPAVLAGAVVPLDVVV